MSRNKYKSGNGHEPQTNTIQNGNPATVDPYQLSGRELVYFVNRALSQSGWNSQRANNIAGLQYGGDRDLYHVLGYKRDLTFQDYYDMYDRQDIAGRIIEVEPEDTWRTMPKVLDGDNEDTPFTIAINKLFDRLGVQQHMANADILAGIGQYGVLYIGMSGNSPLESQYNGGGQVVYLAEFDEGTADISTYEKMVTSPRYGMPLTYGLSFDVGSGSSKKPVHFTRCIHVAENIRRGRVFGTPRLRSVFNRLYDVEKTIGGGAEAFWRLVYQGLVISTKDGYSMPSDQDEVNELNQKFQDFVNDMRRVLPLEGMDVKPLGGQSVDPDAVMRWLIMLISGTKGIPQRLLLGSERGELASSQDAKAWSGRISARRLQFAEPVMLRPFIDKMIQWQQVPKPSGNYTLEWEPILEQSDLEKADKALKQADIIVKLSGGNPSALVGDGEAREMALLPAERPLEADPSEGLPDIEGLLSEPVPALPVAQDEVDALLGNAEFRRVTYNGVTVQATRIRPSTRDDKKYMVTVKSGDSERVVHFGDPNLDMQRDIPDRRKAFQDRHSCSDKKDPFAPGFWACYAWEPDTEIP